VSGLVPRPGGLAVGYQLWSVYLTSQVLVAISLVALWRLARLIVTRSPRWSPCCAGRRHLLHFVDAQPVSDLIELPLLGAGAAWSFYRGLACGARLVDGCLLGPVAPPARPTANMSRPPRITMVAFMSRARRRGACWRTPGPYLCGALCLALLAPQLWWRSRRLRPLQPSSPCSADHGLGRLADLARRPSYGGELAHIAMATLLVPRAARLAARRSVRCAAGDPSPSTAAFVATLALGPILLMLASP